MRRFVALFLAFVLCFCFPVDIQAENLSGRELYSLSAVLIDGDSGRVLFGKDETAERAMASTTKIMTLILALEYGNIDDVATVSDYAQRMPDVQMNVKKGEQYYIKDLLYAMILESFNDVSVVVAEHVGGSVEEFALMMNKKAMEIGMYNTYFITPNGLDAKDEKGTHHTTAYDLALLMRYCVMRSPKREEFISICQTKSHSFYDFSKKRLFQATNKNRLFDMIDGVLAGKTGFTGDAGYCYTAAVSFGDKTYIIALLGCGWPNNKNYKWSDSKKLFYFARDNYERRSLLKEDMKIPDIPVSDGIEADYVSVCAKGSVEALVSNEDKVEYKYNLPDKIRAPIYEGDIVGCITVYVEGYQVGCVNVFSKDTVNRKDYMYYLEKVLGKMRNLVTF